MCIRVFVCVCRFRKPTSKMLYNLYARTALYTCIYISPTVLPLCHRSRYYYYCYAKTFSFSYIYIYIFLFFSFSFALLPLFHTLFIMRCGFRARQFSKRSAAKCVKHIHIGTNAICQRSSYHIFLLNTFIYFQLFKKK
uniref:Uncharacterized protein n=1 Tax=Sipha flava TaxID=143950 RepID=A0A2S2QU14_9HEMI